MEESLGPGEPASPQARRFIPPGLGDVFGCPNRKVRHPAGAVATGPVSGLARLDRRLPTARGPQWLDGGPHWLTVAGAAPAFHRLPVHPSAAANHTPAPRRGPSLHSKPLSKEGAYALTRQCFSNSVRAWIPSSPPSRRRSSRPSQQLKQLREEGRELAPAAGGARRRERRASPRSSRRRKARIEALLKQIPETEA